METRMETVSVAHGKELIAAGVNLWQNSTQFLKDNIPAASRYVVVSDTNVWRLHGPRVLAGLRAVGVEPLLTTIEPGEASKTRATKERLEDWMLEHACTRDTCLIAVGGGVVGDLVGFVAATYMRGIPVVQVPTTLLAMVDSSIGGKTAVDTEAGKNLIGAFHHPAVVFIDTSFLKTLPLRELSNGMAEVIKTAAIRDRALFELLENNPDAVLDRDEALLQQIVVRAAGIKAHVVSIDERESGLRCILNWGHTIGHAIEALVAPQLLHGECVSIGMVLESHIALKLGQLGSSLSLGRIVRCLQAYKLPIHLPAGLSIDDLLRLMQVDKKNAQGQIRCVMLRSIGSCLEHPLPVPREVFRQVLSPQVSVEPVSGGVTGTITVPGSKSISNRVLPLAALASGECRIRGLLHADDTSVMLDALRQLGATFAWEDDGAVLHIVGAGGTFVNTDAAKPIFLGNAGTASRFLTTMATLLPDGAAVVLTGSPRLKERPIKDLTDALLGNGCKLRFVEKPGCFPVEVSGGGLPGGEISLSATVSSQFVSSILLSAPYARQPVTLRLKDGAVSRPFIDMTVQLMRQFGIAVQEIDRDTFFVPQGVYRNPPQFTVECDASSASYPLALAAITGGRVTVDSIGSASVQGDAQFYTVLEKMGCAVSQSETSTTVCGPAAGQPLRALRVDMSAMTDTFMTVAVLAAVADGTSVIHNIANQRVKECNRIFAMVEQLSKLGVNARETADGLEIEGCAGHLERLRPAEIACYNDHRIAMSFAVLAARVPGIVITDKQCVDKTYPEFWTDLEARFAVRLLAPPSVSKPPTLTADPHAAAEGVDTLSVVIVGMRGSGKSTMSAAVARILGWHFIDLDDAFSQHVGEPIGAFVGRHGWPAMRDRELDVLRETLFGHRRRTIIATGGGIVETPAAVALLQAYPGLVVQLTRDASDVEAYLASDTSRANLGEPPAAVWARRKPLYRAASKYEFVLPRGECDWPQAERAMARFVADLLRPPPLPPSSPGAAPSFFLSLTVPTMHHPVIRTAALFEGVAAVELRVDLLESDDHDFIKEQVCVLRRHTSLPIIYTLRSKTQGGAFSGDEQAYLSLLRLGLRTGCRLIDLEACWSASGLAAFLEQPRRAAIIGSMHNFAEPPTEQLLRNMFNTSYLGGQADIVKVVGMARSIDDTLLLQRVASSVSFKRPLISICAGDKGKLSRVLNGFLTPVTHPLLPVAAAPGQLSVSEIMHLRAALSFDHRHDADQQPAQQSSGSAQFYLFGSPISLSPSPLLHNTAFAALRLPYRYELFPTLEVEAAAARLKEAATLGGSVTIPHKQAIVPYLDELSTEAAAMGAVNTVIKLPDGRLRGDNTDWLAIHNMLDDLRRSAGLSLRTGLVIGAGGTAHAACYALMRLGVRFSVYNRTAAKAQELSAKYGGTPLAEWPADTADSWRPDVVISTVPPASELRLPAHLWHPGMAVVELVYTPRETLLVRQAREFGRCHVIEGIELLLAQGAAQFALWTGREAPRADMVRALLHDWHGGVLAASPPRTFV
eukprot:TRINITY_DN4263_c0_g1_i1.p1 TRINITY_DN4263_c0_g1~~TRINITY_DN4263_c0_g1_i1.p1  ORF type:complete len:1532 (-),score=617.73 TRINITY_DN4263_c0_g1_i1:193-4788(-)